ncbi:MAG: phosphoribosylformylglycinamidine cyclo-ligase [candidate division Zixibacteria bacterium]|nr:phosphoribosylformylglycinamidine cyclo-ligase [candidate division Zixibacteria bacterium]
MAVNQNKPKMTYVESGVDVKAGEAAVERIKKLAAETFNENVLHGLGAFCGFYKPNFEGIEKPVLVSSADGVGTKLKLAFMTNRHNTVGEDLVNHCVNDILVHGARPLFFLDYIATGKLDPEVVAEIVSGISRGCSAHEIPLLGGETAEMPDFYQSGEYDLAGFVIGIVDESKIINGSAIKEGNLVLGLKSEGLHTNGYSLARKAAFDMAGFKHDDYIEELETTVGEALLEKHLSYFSTVYPLLSKIEINGMAHITGGGIAGNLKRILPENLDAEIETNSWQTPPIFGWLQSKGEIDDEDMYSAFNMGIGFVIVADGTNVNKIIKEIDSAQIIGKIVQGSGKVKLV